MSFKKLALITAMFAATTGAYAMEALDDESMAAATGQDGITIGIKTNALTLDQIIHDRDGYTFGATPTDSGALVMRGIGIDTLGGEIVIKIDADGNSNAAAGASPALLGNAYLNINVAIAGGLQIKTGNLTVANSNIGVAGGVSGTGATVFGTIDEESAIIMDSQTITLGATNLNIQLGNEVQTYTMGATTKTAMILMKNTTMTGGLTIGTVAAGVYSGGLKLNDANGSSISIGRMTLKDAGGTDLTLGSIGVNVETGGLVIDIASIGDATNGLYQSMERVALGTAPAIGDIEVTGLKLNGTSIRISGH